MGAKLLAILLFLVISVCGEDEEVKISVTIIEREHEIGKEVENVEVDQPAICVEEIAGHIDGRVLPATFSKNNGRPYVITNQRLQQIRGNFMYWFYDHGGNQNNGDYQKDIQRFTPVIHKNLNFQLPFFGFRLNYTRVSMDGHIFFSDLEHFYTYPLVFPVRDWPKVKDPSFIGIFFSKCRIGNQSPKDPDQRNPGVYFRIDSDLQTRTDQLGVEMRERLTWDIREGIIGADTFTPKHAITVTWKNMSFAGGIDSALDVTNTFQMVVATDEVFTYVIFNYLELNWNSHTEAGADTAMGIGGIPAFVGFNAGNGTRSYEYQPYSQSPKIQRLTTTGMANGFPGRHIFRIDENIVAGTCNIGSDAAVFAGAASLPLTFSPESGNMLGGTVVNITGPCFKPDDKITCRFDTEFVMGAFVDVNKAICVQPRLYYNGYIKLAVAINNEPFKWKAMFFIETPATATERIYFPENSIYEKNPSEIRMTWNRSNLTTNVQISLWGYEETEKNGVSRPKIEFIDTIDADVVNSGEYVINPENFRNRNNILQIPQIKFGFIQINMTKPEIVNGVQISPILWSRPIPLAWYFSQQWQRYFSDPNWSQIMCQDWLLWENLSTNFGEFGACPCVLGDALSDKGRFMLDLDCAKDTKPTCAYRSEGINCVISAPSSHGSGQQCCYDINGLFIPSNLRTWGSRFVVSQEFGLMPYNRTQQVPSLSHWLHDLIPFYECCVWHDNLTNSCEEYKSRPFQLSENCSVYQTPGMAGIYESSITTFNHLQYSFNGKGEYVLVRTPTFPWELEVQGRFEQLDGNVYGSVNATRLTSVVAVADNCVPIEVRLRPTHAQWRYRLDVFANNTRIYFDQPALRVQNFPGVTVYQPMHVLNQSEIVIMFPSGAGVEVVENNGFMTTKVVLPQIYKSLTSGLFGKWSYDPVVDFTKPDGTEAVVVLRDPQSVYRDFAQYWQLTDEEQKRVGVALFTREFGRTASDYNDNRFQPKPEKPVELKPQEIPTPFIDVTSKEITQDYGTTPEFMKNYLGSINLLKRIVEQHIKIIEKKCTDSNKNAKDDQSCLHGTIDPKTMMDFADVLTEPQDINDVQSNSKADDKLDRKLRLQLHQLQVRVEMLKERLLLQQLSYWTKMDASLDTIDAAFDGLLATK